MQITVNYSTHRVQGERSDPAVMAEDRASRRTETRSLSEWLKIAAHEPHTMRSAAAGRACRKQLQNGAWLNWMCRINPEYQ